MSEQEQPIDKKTRWTKRAKRTGGVVLGALMAGGLVAGCSVDLQPNNPTVSATKKAPKFTPSAPDQTSASVTPEQQARGELEAYISSKERNDRLEHATNTLGLRIMKAARAGKLGPFDAFNPKTDEWASKDPQTKGWVWYQHNPQYGGTDTQYALTVYRNPDGSYDLDKGIKSVSVTPASDAKGSKGMELSAEGEGMFGADQGYSATVLYEDVLAHPKKGYTESNWADTAGGYNIDSDVASAQKAKAVEADAIRVANHLLEKDGVQ